jgi:N-ethylmaleimide reductase
MSTLFNPYRLGNIELQNRTVMAPMTRSRAIGNKPNELVATYYAQRAGAGLIVTEGTSPSPNGLGYARIPGIYDQQQITEWKKVTDAVHARGGKIFVQLMHTGRVTHPDNLPANGVVLAPSAVQLESTKMWVDGKGTLEIPLAKEMTRQDVLNTIDEYIQAAKNAVLAGFDGIEIHGANGYLVKQFLNPHTNRRTDDFGGSIENRSRFLLEIVRGVIAAVGKDKVGVRLSPYNTFNETPHYTDVDATYDYLSTELNNLRVAYLHVITAGVPDSLLKTIRSNFTNSLIVAGDYNNDRAVEALEAGADLVAFGRPFLANPDLVDRLRKKLPFNQPNYNLLYTPAAEGYLDYPVFENAAVFA